ncbi:toll/interleukin-1 receptor domain-containing protein [Planctomicrobium sp. SH668]|uniref:toll/interleukin-1 receptor domain-containing protein n=1 Tax=Planctomicrobium sp. SH668 TaxID=3448126 RepID=UPI003F5CB0FF
MRNFGVTCFVAHEDIQPSQEWQKEIEKALFSMHVLVPLLTETFHESNWTDQEIGVAIGRDVPVISVRVGTDPYGFIGKYQAIQGLGKTVPQLAEELWKLFLGHKLLADNAREGLINNFCSAASFEDGNAKMQMLSTYLDAASPAQIARMEAAVKENYELENAFKVQSQFPVFIARMKALMKQQ